MKKRRAGEVLTVDDIPTIVKAVMDSLPGPSMGKSLDKASDDNSEVPAAPKGK